VAFFDDDPPTQLRRSSPPPRGSRPSGTPRGPGGSPRGPGGPRGPQSEAAAIRNRRIVAVVGVIVVLILLAFVLKSCADTAKRNGLKSYNGKVNQLAQGSNDNVAQAFVYLTNKSGAVDQSDNLASSANVANDLTNKARKLSTPGSMKGATQNALQALSLRATALQRLSQRILVARGSDRTKAIVAEKQMAGQMLALSASDVLWQLRVRPFISQGLASAGVGGQTIANSRVLKNLAWFNSVYLAQRIGGQVPDAGDDPSVPIAAGTHGHGLTSTTANGTTLSSSTTNQVSVATGLTFVVKFANQGENNETNVKVTVSGTDNSTKKAAFKPVTRTVPSTTKGATITTTIPITSPPAAGSAVAVKVSIGKVPGEVNVTNNTATYNVLFG
jgi:hypothetical protein